MSKIKLLNNQGDEVTIEHSNTSSKQGNSVVNIKDVTKQADTIADLKALDGAHKLVYVTGYHTKGDGAFGSHFFEWDTTSTEADNGATIIKLNSVTTGRYKLKYDGSVNVKWFGAKGDGVTDDTEALQSAIDTLKPITIPKGTFKLLNGLIATHEVNITCYGELKYEGTIDNDIVLDITTSTDDLDFEKSPVLQGLTIIGNDVAYCGIRINSVFAPKVHNYTSKGFNNGWALVFRNIALTSGARWCEAYSVENINSNYNYGGIRFHVDGGTTSFGYGYLNGNIINKQGTDTKQSIGMLVETTQLYQAKIYLNIWNNGYGTAIKLGSDNYPNAKIYWSDILIGGELFNSNNVGVDLTNGEIFGCTGSATFNQGVILNPSNNRLEIYGQYQKTNYGNTTKQINGHDTKLTPLAASFQVEDAFDGKPEAGFGISTGTNIESPIIWMRDFVGNSFRVVKALFNAEPQVDDYLFDVYYDGTAKAKTKFKAPLFTSYETSFTATGSTTTTKIYRISDLIKNATRGTFLITCNGYTANTLLSSTAIITYSDASGDVISPVTNLISQDYNEGSLTIETYNNSNAGTYSVGNGQKVQIVVTNDESTDMIMNVTITRIG